MLGPSTSIRASRQPRSILMERGSGRVGIEGAQGGRLTAVIVRYCAIRNALRVGRKSAAFGISKHLDWQWDGGADARLLSQVRNVPRFGTRGCALSASRGGDHATLADACVPPPGRGGTAGGVGPSGHCAAHRVATADVDGSGSLAGGPARSLDWSGSALPEPLSIVVERDFGGAGDGLLRCAQRLEMMLRSRGRVTAAR
jgi:hypothetical protein